MLHHHFPAKNLADYIDHKVLFFANFAASRFSLWINRANSASCGRRKGEKNLWQEKSKPRIDAHPT